MVHLRHFPTPRIALCLVFFAECSRAPAEPPSPPPASSTASAPTATSAASARDLPLHWSDPPGWQRRAPSSPARAAEYVVQHVVGDPEDADCVVMTFGPTQGGSVDDNVNRWVGQFNPTAAPPRRGTADINGMKVTRVEVSGTFAGMMMPRATTARPIAKPGWRLIGAIVQAPSGMWFFKMTGPDATVRGAAHDFEDMINSVRPR